MKKIMYACHLVLDTENKRQLHKVLVHLFCNCKKKKKIVCMCQKSTVSGVAMKFPE